MAWRRLGDKPLSEPMMVSSLTHICATRPQWVNTQRAFEQYQHDKRVSEIDIISELKKKKKKKSYWPIPAQTNFHCATTLSCHYIQYSALEPCSCPGRCIYTYMAPNTPTILPYSIFFKPTFMWFMVGAGVIGQPFLSLLDGTPHKQAW